MRGGKLWQVLAIVAACSVAVPAAVAAPRDSGAEDRGDAEPKKGGGKKEKGIETTGIDLFDDVFERVAPIDKTLSGVEGSLRSAKVDLVTALALPKGTPLKDALTELKATAGNKVSLVQKGKVPTLSAQDGVPSNVADAVAAVNGLTSDLTAAVDDLAALPSQIDALVKQTKRFPDQLKAEFTKGGSNILDLLFKLPKASSSLKHNLDVVTGLSDRTTSVTSRSQEILGVVTSSFGRGR